MHDGAHALGLEQLEHDAVALAHTHRLEGYDARVACREGGLRMASSGLCPLERDSPSYYFTTHSSSSRQTWPT